MKFPEIDTHIAWAACASIGLIAAFIVLIVIVGGVRKERHDQCRQAGGVPINNGYRSVCLDRDAVIDYKEQPK
jgi:hypothetical protein